MNDRTARRDARDDELEQILSALPRADRERLRRRLELLERASVLSEERCFDRPRVRTDKRHNC